MDVTSYHSKDSDESSIDHTKEVIIGSGQVTTFPTKIGTTMSNALIDTGATRCCISENITRNYNWQESICYKISM